MYLGSLLIEALVVGAVLAAMLSASMVLYPMTGPQDAAYTGFVLGMIAHLGFELTKVNSWYCSSGAACSA
jgi:hypothetical protein